MTVIARWLVNDCDCKVGGQCLLLHGGWSMTVIARWLVNDCDCKVGCQ